MGILIITQCEENEISKKFQIPLPGKYRLLITKLIQQKVTLQYDKILKRVLRIKILFFQYNTSFTFAKLLKK